MGRNGLKCHSLLNVIHIQVLTTLIIISTTAAFPLTEEGNETEGQQRNNDVPNLESAEDTNSNSTAPLESNVDVASQQNSSINGTSNPLQSRSLLDDRYNGLDSVFAALGKPNGFNQTLTDRTRGMRGKSAGMGDHEAAMGGRGGYKKVGKTVQLSEARKGYGRKNGKSAGKKGKSALGKKAGKSAGGKKGGRFVDGLLGSVLGEGTGTDTADSSGAGSSASTKKKTVTTVVEEDDGDKKKKALKKKKGKSATGIDGEAAEGSETSSSSASESSSSAHKKSSTVEESDDPPGIGPGTTEATEAAAAKSSSSGASESSSSGSASESSSGSSKTETETTDGETASAAAGETSSSQSESSASSSSSKTETVSDDGATSTTTEATDTGDIHITVHWKSEKTSVFTINEQETVKAMKEMSASDNNTEPEVLYDLDDPALDYGAENNEKELRSIVPAEKYADYHLYESSAKKNERTMDDDEEEPDAKMIKVTVYFKDAAEVKFEIAENKKLLKLKSKAGETGPFLPVVLYDRVDTAQDLTAASDEKVLKEFVAKERYDNYELYTYQEETRSDDYIVYKWPQR